MSERIDIEVDSTLLLAAEDCEPAYFDQLHTFSSRNDKRVLSALIAHGPVLLKGGRGSGKSALMIAASRQLDPVVQDASAIGIYMSLRHAPLLKSTGEAYGKILCSIIIERVKRLLGDRSLDFDPLPDLGAVQFSLSKLAEKLGKRIVLFFDDAAHLGREASLEEFFDIYRTLSSNSVSCKASIYPGVTRFGVRFDVYNDATVVDIFRSEEVSDFADTFLEVMNSRYPNDFNEDSFSSSLQKKAVASFLGQAVLGNMRSFVFACNALQLKSSERPSIGLPDLNDTLLELASNYYWPLLDEIRPKLGMYEPMVETARVIAELLFTDVGQKTNNSRDIIIHRDIDEKYSKPLQILEYAGFISKREASRALKSGGRGARYALNLCNLLEQLSGSRLTKNLFDKWSSNVRDEAIQFSKGSRLSEVTLPSALPEVELAIFSEDISALRKSNAYPYGLSSQKIQLLKDAHYNVVGDLVEATDDQLQEIRGIGAATVFKIRNVLGQAIWM
ncbi:TPA: ATP-binding protein [Morganella morganii]|nr:ATP-binding protein [Morganella morganii]